MSFSQEYFIDFLWALLYGVPHMVVCTQFLFTTLHLIYQNTLGTRISTYMFTGLHYRDLQGGEGVKGGEGWRVRLRYTYPSCTGPALVWRAIASSLINARVIDSVELSPPSCCVDNPHIRQHTRNPTHPQLCLLTHSAYSFNFSSYIILLFFNFLGLWPWLFQVIHIFLTQSVPVA